MQIRIFTKKIKGIIMQKIGFIGLGLIGTPMCLNLIKAKYHVSVWNRTKSKAEKLVQAGAVSLESPKEVAETSEIIITCVSDSKDVKEVVLGKTGVIEGVHEGSIVIDMSTISPSVTREIANKLSSVKAKMLERKIVQEKIGNVWNMRSLGVIEIDEEPIKWINVLKQDGGKNNPPRWRYIYIIPDERISGSTKIKVKTHRKKSFPLFGKIIDNCFHLCNPYYFSQYRVDYAIYEKHYDV